MVSWQGDLLDHEGLVKALKQVDVVISTVGKDHLANQEKLVAAIKEAGNIKVMHVSTHPPPAYFTISDKYSKFQVLMIGLGLAVVARSVSFFSALINFFC